MADTKTRKTHERRDKWWVVHQHDEVTVVNSEEIPSTEVKAGERFKRIHGHYATREEAQERADAIYATTFKGMMEKAGMA